MKTVIRVIATLIGLGVAFLASGMLHVGLMPAQRTSLVMSLFGVFAPIAVVVWGRHGSIQSKCIALAGGLTTAILLFIVLLVTLAVAWELSGSNTLTALAASIVGAGTILLPAIVTIRFQGRARPKLDLPE